jgi:hypothetical protein
MSFVTDERFEVLFGHLPLLTFSLRTTRFSEVTTKTFSSLTRLQYLDLSSNKIIYIPDGAFDKLVDLRELYLAQNRIQTIGEQTFGENLMVTLKVLRLGSNPFVCSCDLLWFRGWLKACPELFVGQDTQITEVKGEGLSDKELTYKCSTSAEHVAEFHMAPQACLLTREVSGSIIAISICFVLSLTAGLLFFIHRLDLRLWLEVCRQWKVVWSRGRAFTSATSLQATTSWTTTPSGWRAVRR